MTLLFADTSALVRAYLPDEPDHAKLRQVLLDGDEPVALSELARVEFASAVSAAGRAGRVAKPQAFLDRFDADLGDDGPLTLLALDPGTVLPLAYRLVGEHRLRTIDAMHLAVALTAATELADGDQVCLVTRDADQAVAAHALGMTTA
jgi:uncharacterized protein